MLLSEEEINEKLKAMRGWKFVDGKIEKTYRLPDFIKSVETLNKIAVIAESQNHHPDVFLHDYNQLTIILSSHDEGGVTEKDIKLAKELEKFMALEV